MGSNYYPDPELLLAYAAVGYYLAVALVRRRLLK